MSKLRCVALSDTHLMQYGALPDADVLIHAGDACIKGREYEFRQAMEHLAKQPHPHKIYVPGNHDLFADKNMPEAFKICDDLKIEMLLCNGHDIDGVEFWGSPFSR